MDRCRVVLPHGILTYFGDPCDIGPDPCDAMFALKWNADEDKIYALVIVQDAQDHVFETDSGQLGHQRPHRGLLPG